MLITKIPDLRLDVFQRCSMQICCFPLGSQNAKFGNQLGSSSWLVMSSASMMHGFRDAIYTHLQQTCHPQSPLLRLWAVSQVDSDSKVLVLPAEAATEIAKSDPEGYHSGVWRIATEYEAFLAKALLTNSNPHARGYRQPKSFSAWPRRHDEKLYRQASSFRATLSEDVLQTSLQTVHSIWI